MVTIALYRPQIPPNTGNISRLAVGLDIPLFIVGKPAFDMDDKTVKRAGLDYWEHLKLSRFQSIEEMTSANPDRRIILVTTKGYTPYYDFDYKNGDILLFGSETEGLPKDYIKNNLPNTITIPMPGNVRSLNLSNSAAVVAYHALNYLGYFNNFVRNTNFYTEL